jgi:hypothetical protein
MIHKGEAGCFGLEETRIDSFDRADEFADNQIGGRVLKVERALRENTARNGGATVYGFKYVGRFGLCAGS